MEIIKKNLTVNRNSGYNVFRAQNSETSGISAPERLGDFFVSDFIGSARNILNNSACLVSRFELPIPHVLRELIKKGNKKMKNTTEKSQKTKSTLQSLYGYYCEMRDNWYVGEYSLDQEDAYDDVFNALSKAIMTLPAQCEEDKKIKQQYIKEMQEMNGISLAAE